MTLGGHSEPNWRQTRPGPNQYSINTQLVKPGPPAFSLGSKLPSPRILNADVPSPIDYVLPSTLNTKSLLASMKQRYAVGARDDAVVFICVECACKLLIPAAADCGRPDAEWHELLSAGRALAQRGRAGVQSAGTRHARKHRPTPRPNGLLAQQGCRHVAPHTAAPLTHDRP